MRTLSRRETAGILAVGAPKAPSSGRGARSFSPRAGGLASRVGVVRNPAPRSPKRLCKTALRVGPDPNRRAEAAARPAQRQHLLGDNKPNDFNSADQPIVFITKENRTFDRVSRSFMGTDGATAVAISAGQVRGLFHTPDVTPSDLLHQWTDGIA